MLVDSVKVLVVEDDATLRTFAAGVVEMCGHAALTAADGSAALDLIDRADILVTDIMLPKLDGLSLLKESRRLYPDMPVILMTGYPNLDSAMLAVNCGASGYLAKPFGFEDLAACLRRAERQRRLVTHLQILNHALKSINDSVYITDMENRIIFANEGFCRSYGYDCEEVLGSKCEMLWKMDSAYGTAHLFRKTTSEGWTNEFVDIRKDGSEFPIILSASLIRDVHGKEVGIVRVTRDITERKRLEDTLMGFSYLDALTGIPNRRSFDEKLLKEWERALKGEWTLSMILLDVDYLKYINDMLGHQAGDFYLKMIGGKIRDSLSRPEHFAARFGGDEFALLLPRTPEREITYFAMSLKQSIKSMNLLNPASICGGFLTVSLGMANAVPARGGGPEILFAKADQALYEAKRSGRDCIR